MIIKNNFQITWEIHLALTELRMQMEVELEIIQHKTLIIKT